MFYKFHTPYPTDQTINIKDVASAGEEQWVGGGSKTLTLWQAIPKSKRWWEFHPQMQMMSLCGMLCLYTLDSLRLLLKMQNTFTKKNPESK